MRAEKYDQKDPTPAEHGRERNTQATQSQYFRKTLMSVVMLAKSGYMTLSVGEKSDFINNGKGQQPPNRRQILCDPA
jgi:hypothetical protein